MATPDEIRAFAAQYGPLAAAQAQRLNTTPENVLSQWALETGYGKSIIPGTNNLGNIKGPGVAATDNQLGTSDQYRAYDSPQAGAAGYGDLLARNYPGVSGTTTPQQFGQAVQAGGYAQDPHYVEKLGGVANTLQRYASNVLGAMTGSTNAYGDTTTPAQRAYSNAVNGPNPPPSARAGAAGQRKPSSASDDIFAPPPWAANNGNQTGSGGSSDPSAAIFAAPPWAQQQDSSDAGGMGSPAGAGGAGSMSASPTPAAPAAAAPAAPSGDGASSFLGDLGHAVGLTARQGAEGLASVGGLVIDPATAVLNKLAPSLHIPTTQSSMSQALDRLGLPTEQTGTERVVGDINRAMASAASGVGVGNVLAGAAAPLTASVGQALASNAGAQVASAAGSGAGSGLAREGGLGPVGQTVAGLVGAATPAAAQAAAAGARNLAGAGANLWNRITPGFSPEAAQQQAADRVLQGIQGDVSARNAAAANTGNGLLDALSGNDEALRIARNMQNAQPIVPGSMPTAAEVAESPTISAIQKAAGNRPEFKIPLTEQQEVSNAARLGQLQNLSGASSGGSQALMDARNAITDPLYASADETVVPISDTMQSLMNRPSMQEAIGRARALAAEESRPFDLTDEAATISGRDAHQIKKGFDDILYDSGRTLTPTQRAAITNTQQQFLGDLETQIPAYGQARQAFAAASPQINSTAMAEDLLGDLNQGAMNSTDPQITFNGFKSKLASYRRQQNFPLDPEIDQALTNIQTDLQRATRVNAIKAQGADTFYNSAADSWFSNMTGKQSVLGQAVASGLGAAGAGSMFGPAGAAAGAVAGPVVSALTGRGESAINREIARLLLNPNEFGTALERQALAQRSNINPAAGAVAPLAQRLA
ncbi:MAG TPA: glucosaminidase domain-containing protein, partial [Rhodopila sp.]|nr:glucosaminidase domain-containing protein [Rhodopila sp.]